MKKRIRIIAIILTVVLLLDPVYAQQLSRKELELQRKKTEEQIALTKKILKETKNKKQQNLREIKTIARLIESREQLLQTINQEIDLVNKDVDVKNTELVGLDLELYKERKNLAKAIVQSYKNKKIYNNALYLFSARNFNQFVLRLKFTRYLSEAQEKYLFRIEKKKNEINVKINELEDLKKSKEVLARNKSIEVKELEGDKNKKSVAVKALDGKEADLKAQLDKQKKARENLNAQINAIIAQELRKAREKSAKTAANNTKKGSGSTNKGKTPEIKDKNTPDVTPEVKLLSDNFESNKGKLPWPVANGFISERFGTHAHEKLDHITVQNNGIDIQTSDGAKARCIHKGTVTAIITIPGIGKAVIVNHGEYFTVYSKLREVSVSQGQSLTLKQEIGTIMEGEDGATEIHLEIWYNQEKQNPESWLARK